MKFLQEMIARKRAQQTEPESLAEAGGEAWHDAAYDADEDVPATMAPQTDPFAAPNGTGSREGAPEDQSELFDDGSYDWDLDRIELGDAAEEEEAEAHVAQEPPLAEPAPAAEGAADHGAPPQAEKAEQTVDEDEDDVDLGASIVLRDVIARSRAEAPAAPAGTPTPVPGPQTLEENVEKLRIQRKIWDLEHGGEAEAPEDGDDPDASDRPGHRFEADEVTRFLDPTEAAEQEAPAEPAPAEDMAAEAAAAPQPRRAGRVKTRLLGFHKGDVAPSDPFAAPQQAAAPQGEPQFPVGWMVVVRGPGRGASFTLTAGASKVGRGEDQAIRLDFGDTSISRDNHAAVAYDDEQRAFYIGHGGKANLVRLNDMPVLSTEPLTDGDLIRIGETTLQFVAFCGPEFSWGENDDGDSIYAAAE